MTKGVPSSNVEIVADGDERVRIKRGSVVPGTATGYQPSASGFTGGSVSQVMLSGASTSVELSACSQVMVWPV